MNMNQFTQKSLEAIQAAQNIANEHGNQQIEQAHLLLGLVTQENGFIPQLLTHMGMTAESFRAAVRHEVEKLPKVSGSGRRTDQVYVSAAMDKAMNAAVTIAGSMKDEFVSVEHLLLALIDTADDTLCQQSSQKRIGIRAFQKTDDPFLKSIDQCHQAGNHHVVVGVLREAEADLGQLGGKLKDLDGGILIHAEIDLRVDLADLAGCDQRKLGDLIDAA